MKEVPTHIVEMINEALSNEYANYIEMVTQAAMVTGEQALYLKGFFEQQAAGSLLHAQQLRERIFFLGGRPTTKVGPIKVHDSPKEALAAGVEEHRHFMEQYRKLLTSIKRPDGDKLYETIEEIMEGEQEDLEAFQRLAGKVS